MLSRDDQRDILLLKLFLQAFLVFVLFQYLHQKDPHDSVEYLLSSQLKEESYYHYYLYPIQPLSQYDIRVPEQILQPHFPQIHSMFL
ncbi:hypothetical protein D3C74_269400 [compost metagenome]